MGPRLGRLPAAGWGWRTWLALLWRGVWRGLRRGVACDDAPPNPRAVCTSLCCGLCTMAACRRCFRCWCARILTSKQRVAHFGRSRLFFLFSSLDPSASPSPVNMTVVYAYFGTMSLA